MAVPKTPTSLYGYVICMVTAMGLVLTSMGTRYWIELDDSLLTSHAGLFKACDSIKCYDYDEAPVYKHTNKTDLETVQALCIIAATLHALTFFVMGHLVFVQKMKAQSRNHGWVALFFSILAAMFSSATYIHYQRSVDFPPVNTVIHSKYYGGYYNYGYSLYLTLAAGLPSITAGVCAALAVSSLYSFQRPVIQPVVHAVPGIPVVMPATYAYPPPNMQYSHPGMNQPILVANPYPGMNQNQPILVANPNQHFIVAKPATANTQEKPPSYNDTIASQNQP